MFFDQDVSFILLGDKRLNQCLRCVAKRPEPINRIVELVIPVFILTSVPVEYHTFNQVHLLNEHNTFYFKSNRVFWNLNRGLNV